jgi:hypothetical protein
VNILQSLNPKARVAVLGALLLLPVLGLTVWWFAVSQESTKGDRLTLVLRDFGYDAVVPPSRLYGPGTITTVETRSDGTLQLHRACTMNDDALAAMWHTSATIDQRLIVAAKRSFDSSARVPGATSDATGNRARDVEVDLRNMNIVTIADDNLIAVRNEYLKGPCEQAVIINLQHGAKVCQPEEVLEADVVTKDGSQDGFGTGGELTLASQARGSAKVDGSWSEVHQGQGTNLFLGARISRGGLCLELAESSGWRRLIRIVFGT